MTLAQQFVLVLKECVRIESRDKADSFLKDHAITKYTICLSSKYCGWVSSNVIFEDGSVFGTSNLSVRWARFVGFRDLREFHKYADRFLTYYHQ